MPSPEVEVLSANEAFYEAFAKRDVATMENLWSERNDIACVHPGWDALLGRHKVLGSWRAILMSPEAPEVVCAEAKAHVLGDVAFVVCNEVLPGGELCATNLFVREAGQWKLLHHHAGPVANRVEVVATKTASKVLN
ncbi:MAG: nuclear transport factor 2 family protein [Polyangiaceae bacterium]|nr:nuclear transport factor 2 family protein [Polyangiaceae bacterium]